MCKICTSGSLTFKVNSKSENDSQDSVEIGIQGDGNDMIDLLGARHSMQPPAVSRI